MALRIDEYDPQIHFTPKEAWFSGGSATKSMETTRGTTTAGALMSLNFTGTAVEVYGSASLYPASLAVLNLFSIDGGAPAQWSQDPRTWSGPSNNIKMFSARELQYGAHVLVMKVMAEGSGTWIDYLEVASNESSPTMTSSSPFGETPSSASEKRCPPSIVSSLPSGAPTASLAGMSDRIARSSIKQFSSFSPGETPSSTSEGLQPSFTVTTSITLNVTDQASTKATYSISPSATAGVAVGAMSGLVLMLLLIAWSLRRRWRRLDERSGENGASQSDQMSGSLTPWQADPRSNARARPFLLFASTVEKSRKHVEQHSLSGGDHQANIPHLDNPPPSYASLS
ncbi:hypothetical protein PM082_023070 [Marasmius tenuissimus]|nr:hypothetical protein PM082_023070 [Marasmius tenuissimus]